MQHLFAFQMLCILIVVIKVIIMDIVICINIAVTRVSKIQKKDFEIFPEPKTFFQVMGHTTTLQNPHPFHDIFGTGLGSSDADM